MSELMECVMDELAATLELISVIPVEACPTFSAMSRVVTDCSSTAVADGSDDLVHLRNDARDVESCPRFWVVTDWMPEILSRMSSVARAVC